MMAYEMIGVADENGRTYESKYGTYNREEGFNFNNEAFEYPREVFCGMLMHEDLWSLKIDKKKMTLEDIEKALGYKVEIVEDEPKKDAKSEKKNDFMTFDEFLDKIFKD